MRTVRAAFVMVHHTSPASAAAARLQKAQMRGTVACGCRQARSGTALMDMVDGWHATRRPCLAPAPLLHAAHARAHPRVARREPNRELEDVSGLSPIVLAGRRVPTSIHARTARSPAPTHTTHT